MDINETKPNPDNGDANVEECRLESEINFPNEGASYEMNPDDMKDPVKFDKTEVEEEHADENDFVDKQYDDEEDIVEIKNHSSYEQVLLDVNRCAGRFKHIRQCYLHRTDDDDVDGPPEDLTEHSEPQQSSENPSAINSNEESEKLERIAKDLKYQGALKKRLAKLILKLLIKKPHLHYYQGFHDVCLTYMTIYGYDQAFQKLDSLIDSHFSTFMQPTMIETQEFLDLIPVIIGVQDSKVQHYLEEAEVGTIFALSWVITWFSHVIPNERDVELIYSRLEQIDDPHIILYLCAAIVLYKRDQLIELEPEMSIVHKFLSLVPRKEKLPVAELIEDAMRTFKKWPPAYVKMELERQMQAKLQIHDYNILSKLAHRFAPSLAGLMQTSNTRTAIIVFVVASALALQFDRWIR